MANKMRLILKAFDKFSSVPGPETETKKKKNSDLTES